jgi:hypothetical protein
MIHLLSLYECIHFKVFEFQIGDTDRDILSTKVSVPELEVNGFVQVVDEDKVVLIPLGVAGIFNRLCFTDGSIVDVANMEGDIRIQGTKEVCGL